MAKHGTRLLPLTSIPSMLRLPAALGRDWSLATLPEVEVEVEEEADTDTDVNAACLGEEGEWEVLGPMTRIGSRPSNILNIVLLPDPRRY